MRGLSRGVTYVISLYQAIGSGVVGAGWSTSVGLLSTGGQCGSVVSKNLPGGGFMHADPRSISQPPSMAGTNYVGFFLPALVAAAPAALNLSYTGFTW